MTSFPGEDLYRESVLDHSRNPRRNKLPADPTGFSEGVNPLCGDAVRVGIVVEGSTIAEYGFDGSGCAISQASASILGDEVTGLDIEEVRGLIHEFESLMRGEPGTNAAIAGELVALEGVAKFPMRVKCATLAAKTLLQALDAAGSRSSGPN